MVTERRGRRGFAFVNKEMHYRYVGLMVVTVLVISVIMGAFIFLGSLQTVNILRAAAGENRGLAESLEESQLIHAGKALLALVLILVAVAVVGVMEMSKIAGPLYRITKAARTIAQGDYSIDFKLRTGDIPREVGDSFGEMVDSIKAKTKKDAEALDEISSKLKNISKQVEDKAVNGALEEAITNLTEISHQKMESIRPQI